MLSGCVDDWFQHTTDQEIRFTASVSNQWSTGARSGRPHAEYQIKPMDQLIGKDTVYLHTQVIDEFQYDEANSSVPVSRSTMINSAEELYDNIAVSAYCYMGEYDPEEHTPTYFYNERAIRTGDSYKLTKNFMWPGQGQTMRFAAYAPVDPAMVNPNVTGPWFEFNGEKSLAAVVTIPEDVTQQKDLLIATTDDISADEQQPVNLNFKHALTAVRFEVGDDMLDYRITRIMISLVYNKGVVDLKTGNLLSPWDSRPYIQDVDIAVNGDSHQDITSGSQTFLMLPQTVQDGVYVQLDVVTPKGPTVITGKIAGHKWEPGKTIVYRVSYNNWWENVNVFQNGNELTDGIFFFNTDNTESQTIDILSHKVAESDGVQHEFRSLPWKVEYSVDNGSTWSGTPPTWLTQFPTSGPGHPTDAIPHQITADRNATYESIDLNDKLSKRSLGSASSRYNLATEVCDDGMQNTANTYVVPGWGNFKFPAIYGNAIKNGTTNLNSYAGLWYDYTMPTYRNHINDQIGSPYISYHQTSWRISRAKLLAEDTKGLIQNVKYEPYMYMNPDGNYIGGITFDIPKANVTQGNAIIALIDDSDRVIWSWQIWVTPLCQKSDVIPIANKAKFIFKVSDACLGWVSRQPIKRYNGRQCKMRISGLGRSQIKGQTIREYTVMQMGYTDMTPGDAPFYQWGRKDPFPQAGGAMMDKNDPNRFTGTTRPWYDENGNQLPHFKSQRITTSQNIADSRYEVAAWRVANPLIFHNMTTVNNISVQLDYTPYSTVLPYNLWNQVASNVVPLNSDKTVSSDIHWYTSSTKTIYDPCPPGFKVPPGAAFTGLTIPGNAADKPMYWQGVAAPGGEGFIFRSTVDVSKTVYFGHPGYRDWIEVGKLFEYSTDGYYWTSAPVSSSYAVYMCCMYNRSGLPVGSAHINPSNKFTMGDGLSVRPVIDEEPEKLTAPVSAPRRRR